MRLYDLKAGTNTRRVCIFLAEKGVKLPTVGVDMMKGENKGPEYLSKNPMGTIPLLELDDGTQLAESVAICRYMEELHPEPASFRNDADCTGSDRDVESANGVIVSETDN
jgi:glutathione S-transferase